MAKSLFNVLKCAFVLAFVLCALMALSGCRETDVLKELINDQTSDNIDYDNPIKQYKNVPNAEQKTEELPQLMEWEDANIERERENENPVQGDDFTDITAPEQTPQQDVAGEAEGWQEPSEGSSTTKKEGDAEEDESNSGEGGDSADKESKGTGDTEKAGAGGTGTTVDLSGNNEPPENAYDKVVAFGECANIVMMLAGEGALAGSDANFLQNQFIQEAYASQGIANVAMISADAPSFDVQQVIDAAPEALLVMNGTYEVTPEQTSALNDADIDVVFVPGVNSHTSIKGLVRTIGTLFGDASETPSGRDAKGLANEYCDWANNQVKSITRKNGGLMTYGGVNYDTGEVDTSKAITGDPSQINWGLYVYDWDFNAVYSASPNKSHIWDAQGVALAKTGYTWSPLYYYMSVGGVNNNAAQFHVSATRPTSLFYIWQFNLSYMGATTSRFQNATITTSKLEDFADNDVLVRTMDPERTYSLGCDNFRTIIVKSRNIARALETARDEGTRTQSGLYAAYQYQDAYGQTGIGFYANQNMLVPSYIGYVEGIRGTLSTRSSTAYERFLNGENPYEVVTNPHGLYSSWTNGSVESVLECQWIDDLYHANGDYTNTGIVVREFYEKFYGYPLSDDQVASIIAGWEE